ncbi:MAG: RNA polymerase Rpb4 [Candidatus Bathyarchaeota archaeon]|nr:MAG: RNA polymerase Rpb4 [Candidatus Bathyarchaeota archaeon]
MSKKTTKERVVAIPEVKKILESIGEEHLDQFQRRSLDYAAKFSKVDYRAGKELAKRLVDEFELEEEEAVQIVNCIPESIEEIRAFLGGGRRIVETSKLEGILALLAEYREEE